MGTHKVDKTIHEDVLYPNHPPRKPTALFLKTRHRLVEEQDLPCRICGVRNSTLKDPQQNPSGATSMQAHHRMVEDSLALAIDVAKFNARVVPGLLRATGNQAKYGHAFTQAEMEAWIHGDEDNIWILCDKHHIGVGTGIHYLTYPIWAVQDLLLDGYNLTDVAVASQREAADIAALPQTTGEPGIVPPLPPAPPPTQAGEEGSA